MLKAQQYSQFPYKKNSKKLLAKKTIPVNQIFNIVLEDNLINTLIQHRTIHTIQHRPSKKRDKLRLDDILIRYPPDHLMAHSPCILPADPIHNPIQDLLNRPPRLPFHLPLLPHIPLHNALHSTIHCIPCLPLHSTGYKVVYILNFCPNFVSKNGFLIGNYLSSGL